MPKIQRTLKLKSISITNITTSTRQNSNLVSFLHSAHEKLGMSDRHFNPEFFTVIKSINFETFNGGEFIHLTRYSEGESASIVPKSIPNKDRDRLSEQAAPTSGDYLNDECFIFVFGKHAIILSNGMNDGAIREYLTFFLRKAQFLENDQCITLGNIANLNAIQKIRKHGVKGINLRSKIDATTWLSATAQIADMSVSKRVSAAIGHFVLKDIDPNTEGLGEYAYDLKITNKGKIQAIESDPLTAMAIEVENESSHYEDESLKFYIELNDGQGLKADEIIISELVMVLRSADALDYEDVKAQCDAYRQRLIEEGTIDSDTSN